MNIEYDANINWYETFKLHFKIKLIIDNIYNNIKINTNLTIEVFERIFKLSLNNRDKNLFWYYDNREYNSIKIIYLTTYYDYIINIDTQSENISSLDVVKLLYPRINQD